MKQKVPAIKTKVAGIFVLDNRTYIRYNDKIQNICSENKQAKHKSSIYGDIRWF